MKGTTRKGRPTKKQDLVRYTNPNEDGVTDETIRIANDRILPHLRNFHLVEYDLKHLLIDVYLQGLRDMAQTIVDKGMLIVVESKAESVVEYDPILLGG